MPALFAAGCSRPIRVYDWLRVGAKGDPAAFRTVLERALAMSPTPWALLIQRLPPGLAPWDLEDHAGVRDLLCELGHHGPLSRDAHLRPDVMGKSGRAMLEAIERGGHTPKDIAAKAEYRLQANARGLQPEIFFNYLGQQRDSAEGKASGPAGPGLQKGFS